MNADQVDALAAAAPDGVDFDGLAVRAEDDRYVLTTEAGSEAVVHADDFPAVAADHAEYVTNWHFWHAEAPQADDRWAFLRWLERAGGLAVPDRYAALGSGRRRDGTETDDGGGQGDADDADPGIVRTWGQLRVTATLGEDGHRTYELRHVDDAGAPAESLAAHEDPFEARELAKHDDRGRYRPLKTAPSLRTGWLFPDLGPAAIVEAVEHFYPATVANWYREREGDLDVTHWRETVDRQSGIYGVVRTWDRGEGHEHVDWVAEACCVDSQCLKRREWEYDGETELGVDGGSGEFPCREPCSVVISAARRWTKLEGEASRTYEFELTPSEKEQVEAIIDAVADGRVDDIREADLDEGANRYRARFLRAKRFDDEGNLCGVPTETDDGNGPNGRD